MDSKIKFSFVNLLHVHNPLILVDESRISSTMTTVFRHDCGRYICIDGHRARQATAQAKALRGVLAATVADQASAFATKADLRELESRLLSAISASKNKVTTRLGAMLAVAVGVLLAVLPMLLRK